MKNTYKIIFLTFLTSVICPLTSISQTAPGIEWQKSLGGTDSDEAYSIEQTSDGGYIVTGYTGSTNGNVTGNHGYWDYWVVKLDTAGSIQWQKCLGGTGDDQGHSVKQTSDGGYVVAGHSYSNDGDVSGNHGHYDYWVVKLDAAGNIQWQKSLGGTGFDHATSINKTLDGGYVVAGYAESNDGNVSGNNGNDDYWVVKLDTTGIIQWQKCFGGLEWDQAYSIQQTVDGGYIVAGTAGSNSGNVIGNHGNGDYWVVKIDSLGILQWQKCLGGTHWEEGGSIQQTSDGGYIVAGHSASNDGDVTGNHGQSDYWVVKLNTTGIIQWQKCLGGTQGDYAFYINQTADGGYVVTGWSYSNDGNVTGNHGGNDYWVVKLDAAGVLQWQKSLGGAGSDYAYSIQQTADGGYVVAGTSISNNGDVTGNHGNYDYWIVKLAPDTITGISQLPQLPNYPITIFPNPLTSESKLTFKNPNKEKFLFTLYDITGRVTESVSTTNNEIILTKGSKPAGVYLFNLVNEKTGERGNGKIVVSD